MLIQNDTILRDSIKIRETLFDFHHNIQFANTTEDSQILTNVITILLALTAAFIALYQVKSNIVSSARITWIENLRTAISNYIAETGICHTTLRNMNSELKEKTDESERNKIILEYYEKYLISGREVDILSNKIFLYLNSEEEDHLKIENLIRKLNKIIHDNDDVFKIKPEEIQSELDKIIKLSKGVFKKEWAKSKKIFKI